MNHENDHMSNMDAVLGQFAQVAVPPDIQQRLDARIEEFCENPQPTKVTLQSATTIRSRRWFVGASVVASVAFLAAAVAFFALGSRDAWAQASKALLAKPWVRFTVQIPAGMPTPEGFEAPEHWLSNKHNVSATKRGDRADFMDLARHEMYSYFPQTNSVTLTTSRDEQIADIGFIETLRQLVSSEGTSDLSLPKSSIQVVNRIQTEVQEEGRRWTEFEFQCRNPKRSPSDFRVTVRVNPDSGLPVEARSTGNFSSNDPVTGWTLAIDYPDYGPSDIYAMGVPKNAAINDRRSVMTENGEEITKFLAAYRAARGKPLGSTSVEMVQESGGRVMPPEYAYKLIGDWHPDFVGYPNIMMGGSPVGNPDCKVTLDRRPALGPPETVLLHILVQTTVGANDLYYWIAPEKGYLVLRYEMHFSGNDHVEWKNNTQIIDELKESPEGRWYPTVVRFGRIKNHGDDLSNERLPPDPRLPQDRDPMEIGPVNTSLLRYNVTFAEK